MRFIAKLMWILGWSLVVFAMLQPFRHMAPQQEPDLTEEWEIPSRQVALSVVDQKKLQQRLAYPKADIPKQPLPDFNTIADVNEKKQAFFDYLRPHVKRENQRLLALREQLLDIAEKKQAQRRLSAEDYAFLYHLYDEFRLDVAETDERFLQELLRRVDAIPESLVLMQAANESAWGTSRFAVEGYNFFGQWCFREGCGMVPLNRPEDQFHEVAKFDSPALAIRSYFYNLNTFHTYEPLRQIRAELRADDRDLSAERLAHGLTAYSERGHEYIAEITAMIRFNRHLLDEG